MCQDLRGLAVLDYGGRHQAERGMINACGLYRVKTIGKPLLGFEAHATCAECSPASAVYRGAERARAIRSAQRPVESKSYCRRPDTQVSR
jgi:hypothetical protein